MPEDDFNQEPPPLGDRLCDRLSRAMRQAGLSTDEIADKVGYSTRTVRRYLEGTRVPADETIGAWAEACGVSDASLKGSDPGQGGKGGGGPGQEAPSASHRRLSRGLVIPLGLVVILLIVTTASVTFYHLQTKGSVPTCAGQTTRGVAFTGETYKEGVAVRGGASLDFPTHPLQLPGGCMVGFRGYCLGETIADIFMGKPDVRWFILPDGKGVIASAVIKGNPPAGIAPSPCAGAQPVPQMVSISNSQDVTYTGVVHLQAQVDGDVAFLGWAAASPQSDPHDRDSGWRQIGWASPGAGGFGLDWDTRTVPIPSESGLQQVMLAAVVCYALESPGQAQTYRLVQVANGVAAPGPPAAVASPPALSSTSKAAAQRMACRLPAHS